MSERAREVVRLGGEHETEFAGTTEITVEIDPSSADPIASLMVRRYWMGSEVAMSRADLQKLHRAIGSVLEATGPDNEEGRPATDMAGAPTRTA